RSLGRAGFEVHAAAHKRIAPAMYSRFVTRRFFVPTAEDLRPLVEAGGYDCVFPLEETTIRFWQAEKDLPQALVALPPAEPFETASDKLATLRLATAANVPVPRSAPSVGEALATLAFPMIIKPLRSSGSRGVCRVATEAELRRDAADVAARFGPVLIQDALPASGAGLG